MDFKKVGALLLVGSSLISCASVNTSGELRVRFEKIGNIQKDCPSFVGKEVLLKEWVKSWEFDGEVLRVVLNVKGGNILNIQDILFWMGIDLAAAEVLREELL